MKIIYCGVHCPHYNPRKGLSFEYRNFYCSLRALPETEVIYFPFDKILEVGKKKFNEELLELVRREKPDLLFCFMYSEELDKNVLNEIRKYTKTLAWFGDDYWRFWNYSKRWAPYFDWVITTYSSAFEWYRNAGFDNVIFSQWACNASEYKPVGLEKSIDVSFVGQKKSGRVKVISALQKAGIKVECFGSGWENGRVTHEEMVNIFCKSKICLNLSDRKKIWEPSVIARIFLKKAVNKIVPDFHIIQNFRAYLHFPIPHTHARPFELAGCKAFVISGWSKDIGNHYKENEEMVFFKNIPELIEKVEYYLPREIERGKIAEAGYLRTMRDHTYQKRFAEIFQTIGIK